MRDLGFYKFPQTAAEASFLAPFYRASDIYPFCNELNGRISLLHADVLAILYHFARYVEGPILEFGPFLGGSTVALAKGMLAAERQSRIVTIELNGPFVHPTLVSDDIVRDLRRNLQRYEASDVVEVIEGSSRDPQIVAKVKELAGAEQFGFLMIDTDGHVQQDLSLYRVLLRAGAYLMVDDFYAPGAPDKGATTSAELNAMEREGIVQSLGVYGWGTWLGRVA